MLCLFIIIFGFLTSVYSIEQFNYNDLKLAWPKDPCVSRKLELPDFREPGRRVSEVKCLEYTWKIKYVQQKIFRGADCDEIKGNTGLLGGADATSGEYPHMGALGWESIDGSWIFKCGGSLISERFVVTAAHCSQVPRTDNTVNDTKPKIVRFGSASIQNYVFNVVKHRGRGAYDFRIRKFIPHTSYNPPRQYYDIALVELENEISFQWEVHPACLWTSFENPEKGKLTGWGVVDLRTLESSPILQKAEIPILDYDECEDMLKMRHSRKWGGFMRHQLCAGEKAGGIDTCQGDSGGPLQTSIYLDNRRQWDRWFLYHIVGVTSFGFGCGKPDTPGIYTRIASFLGWIEMTVWPNSTIENDNRFYFPN